IEKKGSGAIARRVAPVDDRERHARAIRGRSVQALTDVLSRIVAAEDRLLLAKRALASAHVVIENGTWRHEGLVLKANVRRGELRVIADGRVIGGLRKFNAM